MVVLLFGFWHHYSRRPTFYVCTIPGIEIVLLVVVLLAVQLCCEICPKIDEA
jgi:hypothetical protein